MLKKWAKTGGATEISGEVCANADGMHFRMAVFWGFLLSKPQQCRKKMK